MIKKILFLHFFCASLFSSKFDQFSQSFLGCYDFSLAAKFGHEYHPYVLNLARKSIEQMEQKLGEHFSLDHRIIILGFEQAGLPNFFPHQKDLQGGQIDDEYSIKQNSSWTEKVHNNFGCMSAFLFRDLQQMKSCNQFEWIAADEIPLLWKRMTPYQRYTFGSYFKMILGNIANVELAMMMQDPKQVLDVLSSFWEQIYVKKSQPEDSFFVSQDVLFNIENASFLKDSKVEIKKFYVGPDITYPIETKQKCNANATRHAQLLIKEISKQIHKVDDQPTVFVLKSFVDGVGKTTLLANIKNYIKYGEQFEKYESVDNSSSLEFDLFEFSPNVFIADLPAQMSHFTFKPDGFVFVAPEDIKFDMSLVSLAKNYFAENYKELRARKKNLLQKLDSNSTNESSLESLELQYLQNCQNLKLQKDDVSFVFEQHLFLAKFNSAGRPEIKILSPIAKARSEGLKNADPSEMIFPNPPMFPQVYEKFLQDLVLSFSEKEIKRIVFIDFLSMYPRSSRETVRLNYLLQQMAITNQDFSLYDTVYAPYLCNAHLFSFLSKKSNPQNMIKNIADETIIRYLLSKQIFSKKRAGQKELCISKLLQKKKEKMGYEYTKLIKNITQKCRAETSTLADLYQNSKLLNNFYNLDFEGIYQHSLLQEDFFANCIDSPYLNAYFQQVCPLEDFSVDLTSFRSINNHSWLEVNDKKYYLHAKIHQDSLDRFVITDLINKIRICWFGLAFNLLKSQEVSGKLVCANPLFLDNFIFVRKDENNNYYFLSNMFFDDTVFSKIDSKSDIAKKVHSFLFNKKLKSCNPLLSFGLDRKTLFDLDAEDNNITNNLYYFSTMWLRDFTTKNMNQMLPLHEMMNENQSRVDRYKRSAELKSRSKACASNSAPELGLEKLAKFYVRLNQIVPEFEQDLFCAQTPEADFLARRLFSIGVLHQIFNICFS